MKSVRSAQPSSTPPPSAAGPGGFIYGSDGLALDDVNIHSMRLGFTIDLMSAKDPLQLLGGLAKAIRACREVGIDWDSTLNGSNPQASGAQLSQLFKDHMSNANLIQSASKRIDTPERLAIIPFVDEKYRARLKELVVGRVLKSLASPNWDGSQIPRSAVMLAELVVLELVPLDGIAKLLEQQMKDKATLRSAVCVLGILSERFSKNESFLKAVSFLQPLLQRESANDPTFDYDNSYISRTLGWNLPGPQLRLAKRLPSAHSKPIVSSAYFSSTDDYVTGGMEGGIAVWGAPNFTESPAARFTLPPSYMPVAMDGFTRGRVLAVACVAPAPNTPMIRLYHCPDSDASATNWKLVETIERDDCSVITCLKRINLKTNAFVAAEADGRSHNLVCYNMQGKVQRQISGVHKDYVTVLQPSADYNWLFSGSRDSTVKAWDARNFGTTTPLHLLAGHSDAITGIYATADHVVTSGLDQKICLWDIRRLKKPVAEKQFAAPVLKVAVCGAQRPCIVVSTTQSLSLLSFTNLIVDDVVSNTNYTDLRPNHDGSVLFAAGANGADMFVSDPS